MVSVTTSLEAFAVFLHRTGRTSEALALEDRALGIRERDLGLILEIGAESQKEAFLDKARDSIDVALTMRACETGLGASTRARASTDCAGPS